MPERHYDAPAPLSLIDQQERKRASRHCGPSYDHDVTNRPRLSPDVLGPALRKFARHIQAVIDDTRGRPTSSSGSATDWADTHYGDPSWGLEPGNSADTAAVIMLAAAVDHAHALSDILARHNTAAFAVQRACLEAAARARYLAHPGIDLSERVKRYVNDMLYGYSEQRTALAEYDQPDGARDAQDEITKILTAAKRFPEWGEPAANKGRSTAAHVGVSYRTAGNLINELLHVEDGRAFGQTVHRIASAVIHGTHHGFRISGAVDVGADGMREYPPRNKMTQQQRAVYHYPAVMGLYNGALAVYIRMGWPIDPLRASARRALVAWAEVASPGSSSEIDL